MAMNFSSMTMNFLKKIKSQMATTVVYNVHNTTMISFGFQKT
jgi:ABC-type phosphate/phosphonate transport system ATPase subunit